MDQSFVLKNKVRIVTATSLFDGHDAAIHIMRRILQSEGAEVIHLGHNRSAVEVVRTAIQEDVQGIALSSYQGGHIEYFTYILDLLKKSNSTHIKVFGGGGGVISSEEIQYLEKLGVTKIFSPDDGREMGLVGMIRCMLKYCDFSVLKTPPSTDYDAALGRQLSKIESGILVENRNKEKNLVLGITGPGGAGKSSLTDEILCRFLEKYTNKRFAVLSVDPTKKRTGGALLGDRIRMNTACSPSIYMRSMATRVANSSVSQFVKSALDFLSHENFDLIILETAGIGQSSSEVSDLADLSIYVMTPEFGAPSQLEKIDMLDCADLVALNKSDKQGALDALRDVKKAYQRNAGLFDANVEEMPVYLTCAHVFNDLGTNCFVEALEQMLEALEPGKWSDETAVRVVGKVVGLLPAERNHYLNEIVSSIRNYKTACLSSRQNADNLQGLYKSLKVLLSEIEPFRKLDLGAKNDTSLIRLIETYNDLLMKLGEVAILNIKNYTSKKDRYKEKLVSYEVRDRTIEVDGFRSSLSHLNIPKVEMPEFMGRYFGIYEFGEYSGGISIYQWCFSL